MTTADDLRDLRDALDSAVHGALPRWGKPTTKLGEAAQAAAIQVYDKYIKSQLLDSSANSAIEQAKKSEDEHRTLNEILTLKCELAERTVDSLRAERRQLRRRLVECLPWVGCTPYPNTPGFSEMIAVRDLANDTLAEVKE